MSNELKQASIAELVQFRAWSGNMFGINFFLTVHLSSWMLTEIVVLVTSKEVSFSPVLFFYFFIVSCLLPPRGCTVVTFLYPLLLLCWLFVPVLKSLVNKWSQCKENGTKALSTIIKVSKGICQSISCLLAFVYIQLY